MKKIACPNCNTPLAKTAKFCASCGTQTPVEPPPPVQRKPLYKRWWFWLVIILVIGSVAIIGSVPIANKLTEKLIVGDWVLIDDDNYSLSFFENGTFIESDGHQQKTYAYAIVSKSLIISDGEGTSGMCLWNQTQTRKDGSWYVSRDQLILGTDIYMKKGENSR